MILSMMIICFWFLRTIKISSAENGEVPEGYEFITKLVVTSELGLETFFISELTMKRVMA